ncbi:dUTP diphosphatase [Aeribacillus pallidus]|uniref:dUTP diphosphatase n=1 Tax=Aeribacillus pallidus TaxID=33936 RepID=UPI003D1E0EE1
MIENKTINLAHLFDMQAVLDKEILRRRGIPETTDLTDLKIDALDVEIAELQNEVRYFKYWSQDQKPRMKAVRVPAMFEEDREYYNPCLEEFVDGLHFFLSLGNDFDIPKDFQPIPFVSGDIRKQFKIIKRHIFVMEGPMHWYLAFNAYLGLAEMLGFSWDEVEAAYKEKHQINLKRQAEGY